MQWSHWFAGMMDTRPERPHVRLPADVSQRRRRRGDRRGAGRRRLGGDPREVLRAPVLGRRASIGTARCSSTSASCAAIWSTRRRSRARRAHRLRLCCGNGLRADVWEAFQDRFRIPQILEFYAATEGNVSLYNVEGKPGAIGRMPSFLAHRFPVALVQVRSCDAASRCATRTASACAAPPARSARRSAEFDDGAAHAAARFEGYTDAAASREEDPARRVRAGRRLVSHRRSDAAGRAAAFSISSTASATPSAGRARTSRPREVAEAIAAFPGRRRGDRLWRCGAGRRGPRRHGGDRGRRATSISRRLRSHLDERLAGLCAAAVPAHPRRHRGDGDLQAQEERAGARGLRSAPTSSDAHLFRRSGSGRRSCRLDAALLRAHPEPAQIRL